MAVTRTGRVVMAAVAVAAVSLAPTPDANATPRHAAAPSAPPPGRPDPALSRSLDTVVQLSPGASCLTVSVDGGLVYQHAGSSPVVPASTEKLFTAAVALDELGPDHRFTTSLVTESAARNGTITGDVALVGGGDPQLTSSIYRIVRRIGPERTLTLLDDLAAKVAAAGVRHITGRVVGDDRRYDAARTVPSWPDRYARQGQSGPLGALVVDDGYTFGANPGGAERVRSIDPALDAARVFVNLLGAKGVRVDGGSAAGPAAADSTEVASISSAPLVEVVGDMLRASDNQSAELVVKELGRVRGSGGSTAAGVAVVQRWKEERGLAPAGSVTVDGSGLDPGNRVTCDALAAVLDTTGGRTGPIGVALPVAARSGTLQPRFRGSKAAGRLRAKTGSLNSVTALAGFVDLPEGGTATFAYVANGAPVSRQVLAAQDLLATILATYLPPCPAVDVHDVIAPLSPATAELAGLAAAPTVAGALPGAVVALDVFERHAASLADRCLVADDRALIRLIG